ncbi:hypothetical protein [Kineococcus sp. SYSU DK005]|uniref:hypothetical protein n=1 Tax=Kineococcus sp. SYSU DK005 TaxID=3383126 RepID=UPI003D7C6B19
MSNRTPDGWWLLAPLALIALTSCSSGADEDPGPTPDALTQITDIAYDAAAAAGDDPRGAGAGDGRRTSSVSLGGFTAGATYGACTACTGGTSIGMDLAGTAVTLDCDGQAHRVDALVLPNDTATFEVTRPSEVPSQWAVAITMR